MNPDIVAVLDPGHGGADSGAVGPTGLKESVMALDVCLRAQKILSKYIRCELTRSDDRFIALHDRPKIANELNVNVFVSYHFNSALSPDVASSWEIFTTPGQNKSDVLATCIGEEHGKIFPEQKMRADWSDGDLDKEANFAVIRGTKCPSCLMEGEFINTTHGEKLIKSEANRQKMAMAVSLGILRFLNIKYEGFENIVTPKLTLEQRVDRIEKHLNL